ncbi:MAG: hypothetical protein WC775_06260 [Patescibacteria group bacterium]|jgi:hypothetical protein
MLKSVIEKLDRKIAQLTNIRARLYGENMDLNEILKDDVPIVGTPKDADELEAHNTEVNAALLSKGIQKKRKDKHSEPEIKRAAEKLLKSSNKKRGNRVKLTESERREKNRTYQREWARKKAAERKAALGKKKAKIMSKGDRLEFLKNCKRKQVALRHGGLPDGLKIQDRITPSELGLPCAEDDNAEEGL